MNDQQKLLCNKGYALPDWRGEYLVWTTDAVEFIAQKILDGNLPSLREEGE